MKDMAPTTANGSPQQKTPNAQRTSTSAAANAGGAKGNMNFDVPLPVQREPLEKEIQSSCIRWAREKGAYCRKFSSPANRSVPDYLVIYRGDVVLPEFKRGEDTELTESQAEEHKAIQAAGGTTWKVGSVGQFKRYWAQTWDE